MTSESGKFEVVFEGRIAPGHTQAEVIERLTQLYGEPVARKMFATSRVVMKRNLSHDAAEGVQQQLHGMGLITRLSSMPPQVSELSLVEERDSPQTASLTGAPADSSPGSTAPAGKAPAQRSETELKPRKMYLLSKIDDSFTSSADMENAVSKGYGAYMIVVACIMILLPAIYAGIVFGFGYATIWHATSNVDWMFGNSNKLTVIAYLAPIIAGGLLTLFMLKPFVASDSSHRPQPVRLDPRREPAVFHLVERITEELGAPMPVTIEVDADVNASASLRRGVFSRELRLTIGMPLFYGMPIEQLTGVLAHEFGHFVQSYGMRFAAIVHYINYWFHRQAYEEDSWDELIDSWGESGTAIGSVSALLAQLGAFLTRMLLLGLAYIATILSRGLSRQMEFDADRYEVELCGSQGYSANAKMLRILAAGHGVAAKIAERGHREGRLPDNIPLLAKAAVSAFDERTIKGIIGGIQQVNSSVFDTHPPDLERMAAADKLNRAGVFRNSDPAIQLLREPHRLGMHTTLQWYRSLGLDVGPDQLTRSEEFADQIIAGKARA